MKGKLIFLLTILLHGCAQEQSTEEKRKLLDQYKGEVVELRGKIKALEQALLKEDSAFAVRHLKATLVTTRKVAIKKFEKFLEVSGEVASRKNILLSASVPGTVEKIPVSEGMVVQQDELLVLLDTATERKRIAELKTALELATTVYERQDRLWQQNIGTEIQHLKAKNNKASLERQLATAYTQLEKMIIKAPFMGNVDEVFIREGETALPGSRLVRIVNLSDLYVEADLSERYVGKIKKGDQVKIKLPSLNKTISSSISAVGQVINEDNRTFTVEVKIPIRDKNLKPNLLATMEVKELEQANAVVIPTYLVQQDNRGDYVFIIEEYSVDQLYKAKKVYIQRGYSYGGETTVLAGLTGEEKLIDQGFRQVDEGGLVQEVNQTRYNIN
ncbi:MAG: efflux RND transporter periplasmic adaptor subunit [Cytophagales bacterium]|nr:efflux RND transporter periplasmic adaptor subunit [Cytophagales bacterium]